MVGVAEDADGKALQVAEVLEEELATVLPESLVVIPEEPVLDHLLFVGLPQELQDLVRVTHAQCLRLLERVHEVEVEGLARVPDQRVRRRVVLVVEGQAPGRLLCLALEADCGVELNAER